jgi:hypothetical protein
LVDQTAESRNVGRVEQGMSVLDERGVVLGNVRDQSAGSFLLWRNAERDVVWVSKSAVARVEAFKIVLGSGASQF